MEVFEDRPHVTAEEGEGCNGTDPVRVGWVSGWGSQATHWITWYIIEGTGGGVGGGVGERGGERGAAEVEKNGAICGRVVDTDYNRKNEL